MKKHKYPIYYRFFYPDSFGWSVIWLLFLLPMGIYITIMASGENIGYGLGLIFLSVGHIVSLIFKYKKSHRPNKETENNIANDHANC